MKNILKFVLSVLGTVVLYHFTVLFVSSLLSFKLVYKIDFDAIGAAVVPYILLLLFSVVGSQIYLMEETNFYDSNES
jgi:hypothetical protein